MVNVIDEYPDFLVVEKPPGCDFHDSEGTPGFFNIVRSELNSQALWPVHRLDKPTSGLLLLAKTKVAAAQLGELFSSGQVSKHYLAIAGSTVKKKQGSVRGDMVRSRRGLWRLERSQTNPALTRFISTSLIPGWRLFWLLPKTGRTHQLRVAMKSLSAPILGDEAYGGQKSDRLYLHAHGLGFQLGDQCYQWFLAPRSGEAFSTPEFTSAIKTLREMGGNGC